MVVFTCNPSTQEAKAGELQVQGQPGLYKETLSQKKERKKGREGGREERRKKGRLGGAEGRRRGGRKHIAYLRTIIIMGEVPF
jgi:hypothetical protein